MITGTSTNRLPPRTSALPTRTIREPTLGLPGAAPDGCNVDRSIAVQGSGVRGGVGQLSRREATRDGHILRATTPEGVSPIIGPGTLPLQTPGATRNGDPWPAPGFTSQSPKRSDQLATQPLRHDTAAGLRRGVVVVVVVVVVVLTVC